MTLSNRGWKREAPTDPTFPETQVRAPRPARAFTPGRILVLLGLLVVIVPSCCLVTSRSSAITYIHDSPHI
jgi:hypothetical protein